MIPRVLFVTGPTSSGKTRLGVSLAQSLRGEVINADARQLFRDAPIGTGVPAGKWRDLEGEQRYFVEGVPHHLMAVSGPDESWTVSAWCDAAKACLAAIWSRGNLPIVVGGTGLYIRALSEGYVFSGEPDVALRQRLLALTSEQRLELLVQQQPDAAQHLDVRNPHRVLRALERQLSGGAHEVRQRSPDFFVKKLGLLWEPQVLKERVRAMVHTQVTHGWMNEVRGLLERGVSLESPLMKSIGFRTIAQTLQEGRDASLMEERVVAETWQYVRRQMTWLRKEPRLIWIRGDEPLDPENVFDLERT